MPLILAILALGVLIFVHELGHFLVAKFLGIYVERFSIGFGPKLLGIKLGETEYALSAVPLGGYVKLYGEEPGEELDPELAPRSFSLRPTWHKILVVLAGPLANLLFAWFLVWCVNVHGTPALKPEIGKIVKNSPAEKAGLKPGDLILAVNGESVGSWGDLARIIHSLPGKRITITIKRGKQKLTLTLKTQKKTIKTVFGEEKEVGLIGIFPSGSTFTKRYDPLKAIFVSAEQTYKMTALTIKGLIKLITRKVSFKSVGGPIMIVQMASKQASSGMLQFLLFTALISVNLGIINLFPIPILDGGQIVLFVIEAVRRRPLSDEAKEAIQKVGIAIIVLLMLLAMYNDITRIITQSSR